MNTASIISTLGPICKKHRGTCIYDAGNDKFLLKRKPDAKRDLLLAYKSKVFLSFYTHACNRKSLTSSLRKDLHEGILTTGICVEYDRRSRSERGVIVRFYLTDIMPENFAARVNDVAKCVDVVMKKLDDINAFAI